MAELSNVARPYARAVFELAKAGADYSAWSEQLDMLAAVAADPNVGDLFNNPRISRRELALVFTDVCGDRLDENVKNLVRLLAQNRRLHALPAIAEQYEYLRAEAEQTVQAELESALPISDTQQQRIVEALSQRMGRRVELTVKTNEELLGGAVVRAGDLVIDGSIRARLEKLATAISG